MKKFTKSQINFSVFKYVCFFSVFCLFFNCQILGNINPFPFAFLFSLVWCGQNVFLLSFCFLGASLIEGIGYNFLIPNIFTILALIISALIYKKLNKKINLFFLTIIALISQLGRFIPYNSTFVLIKNFCEIALGVLLMHCFCVSFQAFLQRKQKIKFNVDEVFCACVFLVSLSSSLACLNFFAVDFGFAFCVFFALLFMFVVGASKSLFFTSCIGIGFFLSTGSFVYLATLTILSLFSSIFVNVNKYFSVISLLSCEALFGFYLKVYPTYSLYSFALVSLACIAFLLINKKTIKNLKTIFIGSSFDANEKALIEVSRKMQFLKLNQISKVFDEINLQYKTMLKKTLSNEEASFMLAQELCLRCCEDCPNKNVCFRKSGEDVTNSFYKMFGAGIIKKQIGLIDIPNSLYAKCQKSKALLTSANSLLTQYMQYDKNILELNTSKKIISSQMESISKVIKKIATNYNKMLAFDHEMENKIIQELIYNNKTNVIDAIVFKEENEFNVLVSFLNDTVKKDDIEKIISKCCNIKMEIKDKLPSANEQSTTYYLINSPRCDLVFATASLNSNNSSASGDLHTLLKLSSGKYMLGICDGMGSGGLANQISNKTLNLIESYYRAGFESDEIISSVNNILLSQSVEESSALDLCVLDLNNLEADFIKLGAPNTFIKKKDRTEIVNFGTLPIGVVEEIKPKLQKRLIEPKDVIFMISDGVSDCFENENDLAGYISSLRSNNPQELADAVLKRALENNNNEAKDDMTVFVSRVFRKV